MRRRLVILIMFSAVILAACQPGEAEESPAPTPRPAASATPIVIEITVEATLIPVEEAPTGDPEPTVGVTVTVIPARVPFDPQVQPASVDEVLFLRPGGDASQFSIGIPTVELWVAQRDGSGESVVTTYNPAAAAFFGLSLSPDRRWAAVSDTPGAVLIDLRAGEKITLIEAQAPDQWVSQFAWAPDSRSLYYALHDSNSGPVTLYRQAVNPPGQPEALEGSFTVDGLALYPHLVLPDGRVVLAAGSTERFNDRALYDPETGDTILFDLGEFDLIWLTDVLARSNRVLFQAGEESALLALYTATVGDDGSLEDVQPISLRGYGPARFLPDGRVVSIRYGDTPQDAEFVILTPPQRGDLYDEQVIELPEADALNTGFEVLDADTLLLTRDVPPELWVYSISTGQATGVVDIFGGVD